MSFQGTLKSQDGLVVVVQSSVHVNQSLRDIKCRRSNKTSQGQYLFFEINSNFCPLLVKMRGTVCKHLACVLLCRTIPLDQQAVDE